MHRFTVRIVEVYIFYSLDLLSMFLFFILLATVLKQKYSRLVSLNFSAVCQKSKRLCT